MANLMNASIVEHFRTLKDPRIERTKKHLLLDIPHSTRFRGTKCHRSAKPSGGQDLEVEQPVVCWDCSSFDFYSTLSGMHGATLIWH